MAYSWENATLIEDPDYGYLRLQPIPDEEELEAFYRKQYYESFETTGNVIGKLADDQARDKEIQWHRTCTYPDRLALVTSCTGVEQGRLLEIGCSFGDFLAFAKEQGWEVTGVEPSEKASQIAREKGLNVHNLTIQKYVQEHGGERFDCIAMFSVFEAIPRPEKILDLLRPMLTPKGILLLLVANDYNPLQKAAAEACNLGEFWIAVPDRINYFNLETLPVFLERCRYETLALTTDFPMEMFILMGDNYVQNRAIGPECHRRRQNFEMNMPPALRRSFYRKLAEFHIGRQCIACARPK